MAKRWPRFLVVVLVIATSCGPSSTAGDCSPDRFAAGFVVPDAEATSEHDFEVWGLFNPVARDDLGGEPIVVELQDVWAPGEDEPRLGTKIVWRATGVGAFAVTATGPDDRTVEPFWLQAHTGSTWNRPGEEWGTGWELPESGCWTFAVVRGDARAELTVEIRA